MQTHSVLSIFVVGEPRRKTRSARGRYIINAYRLERNVVVRDRLWTAAHAAARTGLILEII